MTDESERTPSPSTPGSVPPWLRTSIVALMAIAFVAHVAYDALRADYESFQTSLLLIGFVGVALGYDVVGRR